MRLKPKGSGDAARGLTATADELFFFVSGVELPGSYPHLGSPEDYVRCYWENRDAILAAGRGPGKRAAAFYDVEFDCVCPRWWDELRLLLQHDLMDRAEMLAVERLHVELGQGESPESDPDFKAKLLRRVSLPRADEFTLRCELARLLLCADWHERQGRQAVGKKFRGYVRDAVDLLEEQFANGGIHA